MPYVIASSDYLFDAVLVWDKIGGAFRPLVNGTVTVTDPSTGNPVDVTQDGSTLPRVVTDTDGHATFTAPQSAVVLTTHGFSFTITATGLAA